MDGWSLFEEWIRELDHKFFSKGRCIALIIDNCPAHPVIDNLKAINLHYLRPNTTSKLQPMDQGVIRSLKAIYRGNIVRKYAGSLDRTKTLPIISLLSGMQMLCSTWDSIDASTIVNCFAKYGISSESQEAAGSDTDDPFKELQDEIYHVRECHPGSVPDDIDATVLVEVDEDVVSTEPLLRDDEILAELDDYLAEQVNEDKNEEDEEDEPVQSQKRDELFDKIERLQRFSLFSVEGNNI